MAKVLVKFRDKETWRLYDVGDEWEGTEERLKELSEGGYIQSGLVAHDGEENGSDGITEDSNGNLDGLTVAELRNLADERGILLPKRAAKAKLLEILGA